MVAHNRRSGRYCFGRSLHTSITGHAMSSPLSRSAVKCHFPETRLIKTYPVRENLIIQSDATETWQGAFSQNPRDQGTHSRGQARLYIAQRQFRVSKRISILAN